MKPISLWMRGVGLLSPSCSACPLRCGRSREAGRRFRRKAAVQGGTGAVAGALALYPDELVSQILMASTYPLEVVQADRWVKSHKQSKGDELAKQLEKEPWDPSVKSLVNFPRCSPR